MMVSRLSYNILNIFQQQSNKILEWQFYDAFKCWPGVRKFEEQICGIQSVIDMNLKDLKNWHFVGAHE